MQGKTFLLLLSFWTENTTQEGPRSFRMYQYIYTPHCVTYLEIQTFQILKISHFMRTETS